jgi:hypothetical protein
LITLSFNGLINSQFVHKNQFLVPKPIFLLPKLFTYISYEELIETFANYKNPLKSFRFRKSFNLDKNILKLLLQNISRLNNLEDLELCLEINQNLNEILAEI